MGSIRFEKSGAAGVLTFCSTPSLCSLSVTVLREVESLLEELSGDRELRALVLTGEGKAFIAGADIRAMKAMSPDQAVEFALQGNRLMRRIERFPVPVIAAVNGFALGGGLEAALSADFIYAARTARLGFPEATLGIMPGFGGVRRLVLRIGAARAKELLYTGRMLDAEEALRWGIVNHVSEPAGLLPSALAACEEMSRSSPRALRSIKEHLELCLRCDVESFTDAEAARFGLLFAHGDREEGLTAFVEKRAADWRAQPAREENPV